MEEKPSSWSKSTASPSEWWPHWCQSQTKTQTLVWPLTHVSRLRSAWHVCNAYLPGPSHCMLLPKGTVPLLRRTSDAPRHCRAVSGWNGFSCTKLMHVWTSCKSWPNIHDRLKHSGLRACWVQFGLHKDFLTSPKCLGALASKCKKQIETCDFCLSFDQVHKGIPRHLGRDSPESLDAPSLDCSEFALGISSLFQIEKETNQVWSRWRTPPSTPFHSNGGLWQLTGVFRGHPDMAKTQLKWRCSEIHREPISGPILFDTWIE